MLSTARQAMHQRTKKSGFTFVETMVAITVLLVAVVAPMSLAQDGIVAAKLAQDQIAAFYLGQEGIEAVKNMRDNNRLVNNPSGQLGNNSGGNLSNCVVSDPEAEEGCVIDTLRVPQADRFWTQRCNGGCPPVRISLSAPYIYTHLTADTEATKYTREIKVWYPTGNPDEAVVEARVTWLFTKSGEQKTYRVRNYLYNW